MINPVELRIGNWISEKQSVGNLPNGKLVNFRITSILPDGVDALSGNDYVFPDSNSEDLFGIPLTEEILIKAGFEDDSYANFTIIMPDNMFSNFKSNARWIRISFKEYACLNLTEYIDIADYDISAPCKYVHQLQNIFHSLTGEELNITLD